MGYLPRAGPANMHGGLSIGRKKAGVSLGAVGFVLLLLVASPLGAAGSAVYSYSPPLKGTILRAWTSTLPVSGCGAYSHVFPTGTLNLTNGQFAFGENGSAALCGGQGGYGFDLVAHARITTPRFTANASGLFVLRGMWLLNLSAGATLNDNFSYPPSYNCDCMDARYAVQFVEALYDLTPFGASAFGLFSDHGQIQNRNGTASLNTSKVVSMPLAVVLTSGDTYQVVITITITVEASTGNNYPSSTTANAHVNFAPNGHPSVFKGFSIQ